MKNLHYLALLVSLSTALTLHAAEAINWRSKYKDAIWLTTPEAAQVADNILAYQFACGGWPKNTDMSQPLTAEKRAELTARGAGGTHDDLSATIDNGATVPQIRFLAAIYTATKQEKFKDATLRGLDYLFAAQYANGGWPQFFPLRKGYYTHITYNDNAMLNVMELLRDIGKGDPSFSFLDNPRRERAADAFKRGLDCILRCQIVIDGHPTVWCAQHDEHTLAPAPARKFEPISFSGQESAGLVRFLMNIEKPTPQIIGSVKGAIAWFEQHKVTGIRYEHIKNAGGKDAIAVSDPKAEPLWARFYEIPSGRPIFIGRDATPRYALSEIEQERRGGYAWYSQAPADLIAKYPKWLARHTKPSP